MLTGTCHCGAVRWTLDTDPESVTACNCTLCRRYGALWGYGHIGHDIHVSGETGAYRRGDEAACDFHFCPGCGCVTHYVARKPGEDGKRWTAVNLRMTDPKLIENLPIDHFDGFDTFDDLPRDGRCVKDMWF